jgi:hypothetical protein
MRWANPEEDRKNVRRSVTIKQPRNMVIGADQLTN